MWALSESKMTVVEGKMFYLSLVVFKRRYLLVAMAICFIASGVIVLLLDDNSTKIAATGMLLNMFGFWLIGMMSVVYPFYPRKLDSRYSPTKCYAEYFEFSEKIKFWFWFVHGWWLLLLSIGTVSLIVKLIT